MTVLLPQATGTDPVVLSPPTYNRLADAAALTYRLAKRIDALTGSTAPIIHETRRRGMLIGRRVTTIDGRSVNEYAWLKARVDGDGGWSHAAIEENLFSSFDPGDASEAYHDPAINIRELTAQNASAGVMHIPTNDPLDDEADRASNPIVEIVRTHRADGTIFAWFDAIPLIRGEVTDSAAMAGEDNRWLYTAVLREPDPLAVAAFRDTADPAIEVQAVNRYEHHNTATHVDGTAVTLFGGTVTYGPIANGTEIELAGPWWFDDDEDIYEFARPNPATDIACT